MYPVTTPCPKPFFSTQLRETKIEKLDNIKEGRGYNTENLLPMSEIRDK